MPPLALVLDLDGTLVDSLPDIQTALARTLDAWGRRPVGLGELRALLGDGAGVLTARAVAATGDPLPPAEQERFLASFLERYAMAGTATTRPFPGVPETLAALRAAGHRLGVCTNKPHAASVAMLRNLGLAPLVHAVLGGDAATRCKPDPAHLRETIAAMDGAALPAVMVGDTAPDAEVARRAGVPFVLAAYGYRRPQDGVLAADAAIASFAELPAALAALRA